MAAPDKTRFWNQAAGTKKFTHPLDHARFTNALSRDADILDFGCGQGRLCAELAELGFRRVVGVDSSPEMVRAAGRVCPDFIFAVNDGGRLPFRADSFDAVLLFAVLTCIPDDAAQKNLLAELKRTLRPGGLLLISDYPLQTDARNLERYAKFANEAGGYGSFRLPEGTLLRHHRREWFTELLAGFEIGEFIELDAMTMNGNPARIAQLWCRKAG
ncbi:MAG: methyltransferase domain-containing protein [Pseudomonadota bacterium]